MQTCLGLNRDLLAYDIDIHRAETVRSVRKRLSKVLARRKLHLN